MPDVSPTERQAIVDALERVGAKLPCPRCGKEHFGLLDGYINHPVQRESSGMVIGGKSIPTATLFCMTCGFMAQHSLGVLGLLSKAHSNGGQENP